ncbi:glycosyltransferase family 1 protein [Marinifilum sp. JC120]|nr:glycosyltransferase family 1 protein [Marinifilum sp. JC120]
MRLLVISPDLRHMGGVVETVKLLLRELEGKAEVTPAVLGRRINQTGFARFFRTLADILNLFWLSCFNRFDVIHMNPSLNLVSALKEGILFLMFCLLGYSGRILIFIHGWDEIFFRRIATGRFSAMLLRAVLNRAGMVLVLAEDFRKELGSIGVDLSRVEVVSTMVDMDNLPVSSVCRDDGKSLLFLSRMIEGKGVYELLDAFSLLCARFEGLELVMAGDGPEQENLMRIAESRNLSNVSFPGYIQGVEKNRLLEKSCIYLLPTSREGCPVSLLEAMSAGLVPVVTDAGGIKDVIKPGQTAVLLDEVSAEAIAGAVAGLIDDSDFRVAVSENARRFAREHFSSHKVTGEIFEFYERLNFQK